MEGDGVMKLTDMIFADTVFGSGKGSGAAFSFDANGKFLYPAVVTVPNTVTALQSTERSFYGHTEVEEIYFESGSTIQSLPSDVFNGCTALKKIELPPSLRYIGNAIFRSCTSLETITIPDGIANLGNWTFSGCSSLRTVTLPASITYMNNSNSFANCTAVTDIRLGADWNYAAVFSFTKQLTHDSMVAMIASLKDLTGTTGKTLTLGAANLARLSAEEIAVATAKNWTLA
jgi:hypothetical protein